MKACDFASCCAVLCLLVLAEGLERGVDSSLGASFSTSARGNRGGVKALKQYLQDKGIEMRDVPKAILVYEGLSMTIL